MLSSVFTKNGYKLVMIAACAYRGRVQSSQVIAEHKLVIVARALYKSPVRVHFCELIGQVCWSLHSSRMVEWVELYNVSGTGSWPTTGRSSTMRMIHANGTLMPSSLSCFMFNIVQMQIFIYDRFYKNTYYLTKLYFFIGCAW